ncbi:MAG: OmpW family outer membrane protein [Pseudomonadota bacterium]
MKLRMDNGAKLLLAAASMVLAASASAQSAGQWTVEAGVNQITPHVDSGDISAPALPHSKGTVTKDTEPVVAFTYGVTDNVSLHAALGLPYKFKVLGDGAVKDVGQVGTVKGLPPTLFVQYRFLDPKAKVRPYVGLGLTYAYFFDATGSGKLTAITNPGTGTPTTFKIDNKFCVTAQAGVATSAGLPTWPSPRPS